MPTPTSEQIAAQRHLVGVFERRVLWAEHKASEHRKELHVARSHLEAMLEEVAGQQAFDFDA